MKQGRVVVVTGGSRNLGMAVSRRFGEGGDTVFVGYRTGAEEARQVAASVDAAGGRGVPLAMELADAASVAAAFATVRETAGPVDVLVNNAAYRPLGRFLDLSDDDWRAVLEVNVLGAVRCAREALPDMVAAGRGCIVNISGLDALWGWGNRAHVTTSKAGLQGLTRAIAVEFSPLGVTVNTILPGTFRTERAAESYPEWEPMRRYLVDHVPVGRQGEPAELAEWCWFLASPAGAYMTGQDIHLNGGAYPLLRNPHILAEAAAHDPAR